MSAVSENAAAGETTPTAPPAKAPSGIPPVPPLPPVTPEYVAPPVPPYAAAAVAAGGSTPLYAPAEHPTEQYPTLPYGSAQGYSGQNYGAPVGYAGQNYGASQGYSTAHGYAPPQGYAPPPQGYGPYTPPRPSALPSGGSGLGVVALVLAVLAAVGASIVGSYAGYSIGLGTAREVMIDSTDFDFDWSILTPVRGWVLLGELAFWAGTILGIWAIVQGIVAIVKNRGRGWGIAAVVVAAIGPIVFATGVQAFLAAGFASGASIGG